MGWTIDHGESDMGDGSDVRDVSDGSDFSDGDGRWTMEVDHWA